VALKGGNFHFAGSTFTTSLWPMMSSGRFRPLPFSRATTLGRFGSSAKSWSNALLVEHLLDVLRDGQLFAGRIAAVEPQQRLVVAHRLFFELREVRRLRVADHRQHRRERRRDPHQPSHDASLVMFNTTLARRQYTSRSRPTTNRPE
jgi:hypothetical protein